MVAGVPQLAHVADWDSLEDGRPVPRREFDFLVEVVGDLDRPLERPKHVEFPWIGAEDLAVLDENRGEDVGLVRHVVKLALRSSRPRELTYPHVTAFVDPAVAAPIESTLRHTRRWSVRRG